MTVVDLNRQPQEEWRSGDDKRETPRRWLPA
jgi:hypothetical protein